MKRLINLCFHPTAIAGLLICILAGNGYSQDKAKVRMDLSYTQANNNLPSLTAQVRTRIDRRYEPVVGTKVQFYINEIDDGNLLGSALTNEDGKAILTLGDSFKPSWDSLNAFSFYSAIVDDPNYQDADDDIEITKSKTDMELLDEDGRQVKITISKYTEDGSLEPAPEVSLKLFVKRSFSNLRVGDDSYETDDDGEVLIDFPDNIPGGNTGELTIIASVDDNDDFGELKMEKEAQWGIVVNGEDFFNERTLWARREMPPIWLLIFPNLIILGIWGTLIYLLVLIGRIKKLGNS